MAKIRGIRPGARVADWQRILDELAAAKTCLCDPAAKSLYDEELKKRASKSRRNPAGKNLLPPSKSTPPKRIEESSAGDELMPIGPSLNPLPPTKGASPATAIAAMSSSSTLPGSLRGAKYAAGGKSGFRSSHDAGAAAGRPGAERDFRRRRALWRAESRPRLECRCLECHCRERHFLRRLFQWRPRQVWRTPARRCQWSAECRRVGFRQAGCPCCRLILSRCRPPHGHGRSAMLCLLARPLQCRRAMRRHLRRVPLFLPRSREPCPWPRRPSTIRRTPDSRFLMICFAKNHLRLMNWGLQHRYRLPPTSAGKHRECRTTPAAPLESVCGLRAYPRDRLRTPRSSPGASHWQRSRLLPSLLL